MSINSKLRSFFFNGGSGTNKQLAKKFGTTAVGIRCRISYLRSQGMPIAKVLPANTLKARYQLSSDFMTAKLGRPAYRNAVKV